jgi:hypothetical protein
MRLEGLIAFRNSGAPEGILSERCEFIPLDI